MDKKVGRKLAVRVASIMDKVELYRGQRQDSPSPLCYEPENSLCDVVQSWENDNIVKTY